ncbi:MAG: divalent metal cation transporter [Planctomycetaceae bacterium]|nr:divalent metal cation transporter [Planctomycetaceae bacterium]
MSDVNPTDKPSPKINIFSSLGPAIITASVVLGPGSIVTASKLGYNSGFSMIWVVLIAVAMMICMTALSARLGVVLEHSLCQELKNRAGTPIAVLTGVSLFLICACFQYSNNLGILLAVEPLVENVGPTVSILVIVVLNIFIIAVLWGLKSLYTHIEKLMKLLVAMMTIAFAINLGFALVTDLPEKATDDQPATVEAETNTAENDVSTPAPENPASSTEESTDSPEEIVAAAEKKPASSNSALIGVIAIIGTTCSFAGAFYQSYLVREKGWTIANIKQGFIDSTLGITLLGLITLMILATAALVLHGKVDVEPKTAADVAKSLQPAFGNFAVIIFCLGIFAGAFSSFLVNSMIGGAMLSDGLGLGYHIDKLAPKVCTTIALLLGMGVAVYMKLTETPEEPASAPANLILVAQSAVVIGYPVLAAAMLWLSTRADLTGEREIPKWLRIAAGLGLILALGVAYQFILKILS